MKKTEEFSCLTESNLIFELLERLPSHVFWKDKDGTYLGCNSAFSRSIGMHKPEDIIGKTDYQLPVRKEDSDAYRESDQRIMISRQPQINIEEKQVLSDGEERFLLTSKVPLFTNDYHVCGILGVYSDVTQLKKYEKELEAAKEKAEAANKAKSEFIANMSHDLRTPLTGIVGMGKTIQETAKEPDIQKAAAYLIQSGNALLNLVNQVIEFSKSELGELPVTEIRFNLKILIEHLFTLFAPAIQEKRLALSLHYDPQIPFFIIGDRHRLYRILLNLIGNAVKFTNQGSVQISVQVIKNGSEKKENEIIVAFSIKDTGIGIAKEKQEIIYSKFSRINPAYIGTYKGYGLGLFTVKRLLLDLGGQIQVESELSKGSIFTITIPFEKALAESHDSSEPLDEKLSDSETDILLTSVMSQVIPSSCNEKPRVEEIAHYKILLVEDNIIAQLAQSNELKKFDCELDVASDGEGALALAKNNVYDLILMDIGLPDKNGIQVSTEIRADGQGRNQCTPIIALTAHVDKDNESLCLNAGMNQVITKPLDEKKLKEIFYQYIEEQKNYHYA